jgi:arsenate reductase
VKVCFACVHNTGRSQMAEAFFRDLADPALAEACSGGTEGATEMNPTVLAAMAEVGLDLLALGHHPKRLDLSTLAPPDRLITMGCGVEVACPALLRPAEDWGLDDPKGRPLDEVRRIRDEIRQRVVALVVALGVGRQPSGRTFASPDGP